MCWHILRCVFKVPSVSSPGRALTVEVEANVTERVPKYALQRLGFEVSFRGQFLRSTIVSYNINEMLGTKLRAMFQRKKGRDLFDLYWGLTSRSALPVSIDEVVGAFRHYMRDEETEVPRAEFVTHLRSCMGDRAGFCTDTYPLLRSGLTYDPQQAGLFVERHVLSRLPE